MQNRINHRNGRPIGVSWHKVSKKWQATAPGNYLNRTAKVQKHIGYYDTIDEAAQAVINFCT